ncbi:MAG: hypothetical protein APR53_04645 [Methanoculleus sp. SDB]|nr:MAG: hypothetical protein APR53_04645 [Methanoculleus sp. SDB]
MNRTISFYTIFYVGSLVFMRGSGILAKILLARSITPFEYGLITLIVLSIPGALQIVTNFCFFDILGHTAEGRKYFSFSLLYGVLSTALIAMLLILGSNTFLAFLNIPSGQGNLLIAVLLVVLFSVTLGGFIMGLLRGRKSHSMAASVSVAPSVLRLLFIICAVYLFGIADFNTILWIFALPPLIVLLGIFTLKWRVIVASFRSVAVPRKEIFLFGFTAFIINAWMTLSQHLNRIVISHDLGVVWQGYFDVSLTLAAIITFFTSALYLVSIPESTGNNDRSALFTSEGGLGDVGRILLSMTLFFVIVIYFYAYPLIDLLFSSDYAPAGDYLFIITAGYALLFVQQYVAYTSLSLSSDTPVTFLLISMASIIAFPFFSHAMILAFGFGGAYAASALVILIYTACTVFCMHDRTPLRILTARFDRLVLACIGAFTIMMVADLPLFPGTAVGGAVFLVLVVGLGYLNPTGLLYAAGKRKAE